MVALVGLHTIDQLWTMLLDISVSHVSCSVMLRVFILEYNLVAKLTVSLQVRLLQHFLARALCLIILPISLYMAVFQLHFLILHRSGMRSSPPASKYSRLNRPYADFHLF